MIRISELRLPLETTPIDLADHPDQGLRPAYLIPIISKTLGVLETEIGHWRVFKRSFDARKSQIFVVYILDVSLKDPQFEPSLIHRLNQKRLNPLRIQATPDMRWHPPIAVAQSARSNPEGLKFELEKNDSAFNVPVNAKTGMTSKTPQSRPVVVGFGPCGIFAALALAQMGLKPIVLERGKKVRERTQDTWGLWRKSVLNVHSNVQFGEGGAGTFSDGKLYSQIKDPKFLGRKVIEEFVKAGAPEDILYSAHPHIGTFKLVKVVENLRAQIEALGGEVLFQQQVTDIITDTHLDNHFDTAIHSQNTREGLNSKTDINRASKDSKKPNQGNQRAAKSVKGLIVQDLQSGISRELISSHVIMALGHSARDTFLMLYNQGVAMHSKPFSVGFRIEHPQGLIDQARWGQHAGNKLLGAADYRLVHHASNQRAVYSFCMCPGGTVVAATSEAGRVVTNGMSQYSRNERNANAAIVVAIEPNDYPSDPARFEATLGSDYKVQTLQPGEVHPLAGVVLQRELESKAYVQGGSDYKAPAQRLDDFLKARPSSALGSVIPSYKPGVRLTDLGTLLPQYATDAMREALPAFAKQVKGFDLPDALLTGVETRTSSPLRIDRNEDFENPTLLGLYPAGEGAGYAGGILSAGVDGLKVAEALAKRYIHS